MTLKTPELEKMKKVVDKSQVIGEFLEWLTSRKGIWLVRYNENDQAINVHDSKEQLLAEFFKINLVKAEREKRMILENIRRSS